MIGAGLLSKQLETKWFSPPNGPRLLLVESGGLLEWNGPCQRKKGWVSSQGVTPNQGQASQMEDHVKGRPETIKGLYIQSTMCASGNCEGRLWYEDTGGEGVSLGS